VPESSRADGKPGIVVLAAGGSSRMGTPKQLLPVGGVSLVRRAAQSAIESGCEPIVVVLGASAELVRRELEDLPIHLANNSDWQTGLANSIVCGLKGLLAQAPSVDSVILMLADQPHVNGTSLKKLTVARRYSGSELVAAWYSNQFGTPALFSRVYFEQLLKLRSQQGAKAILEKYEQDLVFVDIPEAAVDLDTPEDVAALVNTASQ
jgi:molybdenum cofactor cytidylyltransferase